MTQAHKLVRTSDITTTRVNPALSFCHGMPPIFMPNSPDSRLTGNAMTVAAA